MYLLIKCAGVAELADAYGSGPYGGNTVKVQIFSPAPAYIYKAPIGGFFYAKLFHHTKKATDFRSIALMY